MRSALIWEKVVSEAASLDGDILKGASEIGSFLSISRRSAYHQIESGRLPVFRLGSKVCARKSVLLNWIEEQERQNSNGGCREEDL